MCKQRYAALGAVSIATVAWLAAVASTCAAAAAEKLPAADQEAKCLAVLRSDAPAAEKALACKGLAIYGGKNAVPALAPLLADAQLASWARIALEAIPDPAAGEALRQSLGTLRGRLLIGAINSLAVRGDAKAADTLVERLKDADVEVAAAAAVALGRIGGPAAAKTLAASLATAPAAVRSAVAEGCILCAEQFQAEGNVEQAVRLFDAVCRAEVSKQRIAEATRGAILARGAAGIPLLVEQLRSPDKVRFAIGLRVARELPGREATEALAAELPRAAPQRQVLLLQALAERGGAAALPAVLAAARSGPEEVRSTAIGLLGRVGDASCVPVLLEAATAGDAAWSRAALGALAGMAGKEVDAEVAARLAKAEGKTRLALIELAGLRSIRAAVPLLRKAADDPNTQVRAAALIALGATIAPDDLPLLIARATGTQDTAEAAVAVKALGAACRRMPDREVCAAKLAAAASSSPVAAKCRLLEVLAALGGAQALETVAAGAKGNQPEIQETATRLLGEWMDVDAAPVLLDLAKHAADEKYKTRALRGYIRLLRQFPLADEQRAEMCRTAMQVARRGEEKKLVLEVMGRHPHAALLPLAIEAAKIPELKGEAVAVALMIAQQTGAPSAQVQKLLQETGQGTVKIEIVKAEYGAGANVKDVTTILRKHVFDFPVVVLSSPNYNAAFGGDPAPGVVKQLKVQYRMAGKPGEATFAENATIVLPEPK